MSIVWKPIVGFEDCGEISNTGLVRSKAGVIRKTTVGGNGYERVGFYGGKQTVFVHRLVARAFCDGFEDGLTVNHKDGDKLNNNASNLEWATHSENCLHAHKFGLRTASRSRLVVPDGEIDGIIARRKAGETFRSIAEDYGVTPAAIRNRLVRMEEAA